MNANIDMNPRAGILTMLASVFLFATNSLLLRAASLYVPESSAWVSMLYRGAVGLLLVFALYGFGRGLSPAAFFSSKLVMLRGMIGVFSTAAFYFSISHLGAARAVVLGLSYPIFATLIAAVWLKEKISAAAVAWMFAGIGGLALFAGGDLTHSLSAWDAVAVGGAVGAGFVVVLIRKLGTREHHGTIYGSLCIYCIIATLPAGIPSAIHMPLAGHAILLGAAAVVGVSQLMMTHAYRTLPVARGTSIQMLLPLVTAAGAWWCFDERFTLTELAGAAITLAATWRVTMRR